VEQFRLWLMLLIWAGLAVALLTGYFYSPNFRASRADNTKAYWAGMATSAVAAIIATVLLIRG
jgi:hypothetical protein